MIKLATGQPNDCSRENCSSVTGRQLLSTRAHYYIKHRKLGNAYEAEEASGVTVDRKLNASVMLSYLVGSYQDNYKYYHFIRYS